MINMLDTLNVFEKQFGGGIPFSAMDDKKTKKTKKIKKTKRKHKKRSILPSRIHRKNTRKLKRTNKKIIGKKCNCGSHKFTGKEDTPRGLGKCEECIPLNVVMKGKDKELYENKKNGWFKLN